MHLYYQYIAERSVNMPEDTRLITVIPQFLDYCVKELGHTPKTMDSYSREFGKFGRWVGNKRVEELTIHDMNEYFRSEEARGLRISSVNTARATIRTMFYYCQHYRHLEMQFDYAMIKKKKDDQAKEVKYAKVNDVIEAMTVLDDPQDKLIVATLFGTGMRISELVKMKVEHLHEDSNEIDVYGKGNKKRPVPIRPELTAALLNHLERNGIYTGTVFRHRVPKGSLTNHGYSISGLRNRFIRKLSPHGIYPAFHWYRHGIATSLYNDGADIRFLQEFLGHADIRTTQIYTHVSAERKRIVYDEHFPKSLNIAKLLDSHASV